MVQRARWAATRQRTEQNRSVERWATSGLPQVPHLRPARAARLASARALDVTATCAARRQGRTARKPPGVPGVVEIVAAVSARLRASPTRPCHCNRFRLLVLLLL